MAPQTTHAVDQATAPAVTAIDLLRERRQKKLEAEAQQSGVPNEEMAEWRTQAADDSSGAPVYMVGSPTPTLMDGTPAPVFDADALPGGAVAVKTAKISKFGKIVISSFSLLVITVVVVISDKETQLADTAPAKDNCDQCKKGVVKGNGGETEFCIGSGCTGGEGAKDNVPIVIAITTKKNAGDVSWHVDGGSKFGIDPKFKDDKVASETFKLPEGKHTLYYEAKGSGWSGGFWTIIGCDGRACDFSDDPCCQSGHPYRYMYLARYL
eukprot:COSAG05_NODE_3701_length_1897_cov_1.318131_2_plen_267_part_00